jgi:oligopeptide/dipeptide ABC transporter ATP-binding protein
MNTFIKTRNLSLHYPQHSPLLRRKTNVVRAVNDINLSIIQGESLGLVGESGCGKSTLGKTLIRFYTPTKGNIFYHPKQDKKIDIASMTQRELKKAGIRQRFQMLLQDHSTAMNPRMSIKKILTEGIQSRNYKSEKSINEEILSCLNQVGLNESHLQRFPHEFSGGQRQRICIARALSIQPEFIVLDEPTSALDVSVQAQILLLLNDIRKKLGITYLFITHNLLILKYVCSRVVVMYLGRIVEILDVNQLFTDASHPYTLTLLKSVPDLGQEQLSAPPKGEIPNPSSLSKGCGFYQRCSHAVSECSQVYPPLKKISSNHWISCHKFFREQTA